MQACFLSQDAGQSTGRKSVIYLTHHQSGQLDQEIVQQVFKASKVVAVQMIVGTGGHFPQVADDVLMVHNQSGCLMMTRHRTIRTSKQCLIIIVTNRNIHIHSFSFSLSFSLSLSLHTQTDTHNKHTYMFSLSLSLSLSKYI